MLKDIVEVAVLPAYQLKIRFEDGVSGEINVGLMTGFAGVFAPLCEEAFFSQVVVNHELGTIQWPNGADLDPDVLYAKITGMQVKFAA